MADVTPPPPPANPLMDAFASRKLAAVGAAGGLAYLDKLTADHLCTVLIVYLIVQGAVDTARAIADAVARR